MRQKLARAFGGIAIAALVFGGAACQAGEDDGGDSGSGSNAACGMEIGFFGALTGAIRLFRGSHPDGWRTLRYGVRR